MKPCSGNEAAASILVAGELRRFALRAGRASIAALCLDLAPSARSARVDLPLPPALLATLVSFFSSAVGSAFPLPLILAVTETSGPLASGTVDADGSARTLNRSFVTNLIVVASTSTSSDKATPAIGFLSLNDVGRPRPLCGAVGSSRETSLTGSVENGGEMPRS